MLVVALDPRIIAVSLAYACRNGLESLHSDANSGFDQAVTPFFNRRIAHACYLAIPRIPEDPSAAFLRLSSGNTAARALVEQWWAVAINESGLSPRITVPPEEISAHLDIAATSVVRMANEWLHWLLAMDKVYSIAMKAGDITQEVFDRTHPSGLGTRIWYSDHVPLDWDDPAIPVPSTFDPALYGRPAAGMAPNQAWATEGTGRFTGW